MAKQETLKSSECPVARALEAIGERWALLIVREALDDVRRFCEFQKSLGVARNILAARLKVLVELGIFDVGPASDGSAYKEYVLTERGRSLFPVVVALRQWGEQHLYAEGETHSQLLDKQHGLPVAALAVRSSAGEALGPGDCQRVRVTKIL